MHAREYVVSSFALIMLLFFCWPLFALAAGISTGGAPAASWMKLAVGMTNNDITSTVHSLLLPLLAAVIVFRGNDIANVAGLLLLAIMGLGILAGFIAFAFINPAIMGSSPGFKPYLDEYGDIHASILSMTSMLILLFLAKLGLEDAPPRPAGGNAGGPGDGSASGTPSPAAGTPPREEVR